MELSLPLLAEPGRSFRIECAVTDLPEPDSPTSAMIRPRGTSKLLSFTARTSLPPWPLKVTERFLISSSGVPKAMGVAGAAVVAAIVFFATIGPRPDFMAAAHTMRFLFKFVFTGSLALTAFLCVRAFSMPGASSRRMGLALLVAPALMLIAVLAELMVMPQQTWMPRMIGTNSMICMSFIPLIGIGPLAVFIAVLRYGAPTRPALAGAAAGLLAGGLAATFYAAHCFDDSPLFVAVWYTSAVWFFSKDGFKF